MKKTLIIILTLLLSFTLVACGSSGSSQTKEESDKSASGSKPITIRLSGAFAEGTDHYYYFETFCKSVYERSNGTVTVVWGHGPEAIPSNQLAEAMQNGMVELVYTPLAYTVTVIPGFAGMKLTDAATMRASGGVDYVNSITTDKLKAHYLGRTQDGSYFVLGMNKEVDSLDDFKGLSIRGTSATKPLISSLGAEMVTMGWADVYQALEKNVVQGAGGTLKDFVDNDLGRVLKTLVLPGVYNSDSSLLIANHVWDKLDDVQKDAIIQSAIDWEKDSLRKNQADNEKNIATLKEAGVKVVDLGEEYKKAAYEAAWKEAEKADAEVAAKLRSYAGM
ncbi:TRAP transporter substrate-binding protein DctP [Moorella sulfitireducens (nom. illeg.)]|uniref:TRAP transporter substrate-binding protein DctP n=1 Tax=Neomoorella sulfitireducens TaxID=2972948 RepID=UPI0021AC0183|nr:TRAP transporter substrate-binding protein DctP [Moorella sulfitireducens]